MSLKRSIKALLRQPIKLSAKGLKSGPHITRYYMYHHLTSVFNTIDKNGSCNRILSISRSIPLSNLINVEKPEITEANFPEYNILDLPFSDNHFDYVVSAQVLEHVEGNPQKAIDETYRVLKPGGIAIHTTCLVHPIHGEPKDFWRFTPDALILLCNGFSKIIDVGGWGNFYVWFIDWLGLRYDPVPHAKWHLLHKIAVKNDEKWPVVT
ncbi:MAG: class I SAM-dependent methyltransferase [Candidatus Omnitrophota bacterium]